MREGFENLYIACIEAIRAYTTVQPDLSKEWAYQEYLVNCETLLQLDKQLKLPDLREGELKKIHQQIKSICGESN